MIKTVKQIADDLGIEKQKVYRYLKKHCINEAHHEAGVMYYDDVAVSLVNAHFSQNALHQKPHHEVLQNDTVDAVISMLKKELEVKNEQIRELNNRLAESNAALIAAHQSAQAAQILHAGTMQKQLTDGEDVKKQNGFISRIFAKRK